MSPVFVVQRMIGGADNVPLLAIPFFMTLGSILNCTGITQRLLVLSGHLRGGLAQTNVVLAALAVTTYVPWLSLVLADLIK